MNKDQAFNVVTQAIDLAFQKGVFNLENGISVTDAIRVLRQFVEDKQKPTRDSEAASLQDSHSTK